MSRPLVHKIAEHLGCPTKPRPGKPGVLVWGNINVSRDPRSESSGHQVTIYDSLKRKGTFVRFCQGTHHRVIDSEKVRDGAAILTVEPEVGGREKWRVFVN